MDCETRLIHDCVKHNVNRRRFLTGALMASAALLISCRREPPLALRTPTPGPSASAGVQTTNPTSSQGTPGSANATSAKDDASKTAGTKPADVSSAPAKPASAGRPAKLISGGMGISAGIQLWSKPGGVLAGGASMTGIISENSEVEVIGTQDFMGKKHYQVRGSGENSGKEGWIEEVNVQLL